MYDDWTLTWHADRTLTCLLTGYTGIRITSCWRHPYPGLARGSGHLVFGSGQLIRVKKTCVTRGARLCAWEVSSPVRDSACGGFQRPISMRFSIVASSRPPLHSGMVKTQFWQFLFLSKINTPLNHVLWYQLLGIPSPPCADRWCTDICSKEAKHTDTIFYVVRQIAYIHERGWFY
jgi:hypothetical protein